MAVSSGNAYVFAANPDLEREGAESEAASPFLSGQKPVPPSPVPSAPAAPATTIDPFQAARLAEGREDYTNALTSYIRILATDPRNIRALVGAGRSARRVGDPEAALGFLARADDLDPRSGTTKAELASALVMMDRPQDALRLFEEARRLGVSDSEIAGDRGFAYDLLGDPVQAQREYSIALRNRQDSEIVRRLALSQGAAGQMALALNTLDPLLRKQDKAAWRDRAFIIAMGGDTKAAQQSAALILPPAQLSVLAPYLGRMAALSPTERLQAVHFGVFPSSDNMASARIAASESVRTNPLAPSGTPLGGSAEQKSAPVSAADIRREAAKVAMAERNRLKAEAADRAKAQAGARERAKLESSPSTRKAEQARLAEIARKAEADRQAEIQGKSAMAPAKAGSDAIMQTSAAVQMPPAPVSSQMAASPSPAARAVPGSPPTPAPAATSGPRALDIVLPEIHPNEERPVAPAPVIRVLAGQGSLLSPPAPSKTMAQASPRPAPSSPLPGPAEKTPKPVDKAAASVAPAKKAADGKTGCGPDAPGVKGGAKAKPGCDIQKTPDKPNKAVGAKSGLPAKNTCPPAPKDRKGKLARPVCDETQTVAKSSPDRDTRTKDAARDKAGSDRYWAQVASGANKADLGKAYAALKSKAAGLLGGKTAWTTPWRASNRLLVGPFPSEDAAQAFVNQLAGKGISAIQFTSRAGATVERLTSK